MTRIIKKLPLAVSMISFVNIIIMALFFFGGKSLNYFVILEMVLDFYFVLSVFFKVKDNKIVFQKMDFPHLIPGFARSLPFLFSFVTFLFMNKIIALSDIYSGSDFVISFFRIYPNLFFIYIIRIVQFYYHFTNKYKYKIVAAVNVKIFFIMFFIISVLFFIFYAFFIDFANNSYREYKRLVVSQSNLILSESLKDGYAEDERKEMCKSFANKYGIGEVRLSVGQRLYADDDYDKMLSEKYVFQFTVLKTPEFVFVTKDYVNVYAYAALALYILLTFVLIVPVIIFSRYVISSEIGNVLYIMKNGFLDRHFNLGVDTSKLSEGEMKEVSELYNNKYLPLKHRDIYFSKK